MSDKVWINEILNGEREKFSFIVEKYQTMIFRIAMGYTHSKEDAEDLTQDIFIQIYRSLASFRQESEFSTWIYRITVNQCINFSNKNKIRKLFVDISNSFSNLLHSDDNQNALEKMETDEQNRKIKKAIDTLPARQKEAFILSKYNDLSQREIAETMNISVGAVEQLLQRAKDKLKKNLKK